MLFLLNRFAIGIIANIVQWIDTNRNTIIAIYHGKSSISPLEEKLLLLEDEWLLDEWLLDEWLLDEWLLDEWDEPPLECDVVFPASVTAFLKSWLVNATPTINVNAAII